ncbi:GyrI-like domain-containing protein [Sphingobacteriaceae bacterium]|nr:GyrI-like domain-containing protein [Sphingobacteriaceae bacterium]
MLPEITTLQSKKLIGMQRSMSFAGNTTPQLWGSFMPRKEEIQNVVGSHLYSVQSYGADFFKYFDPKKEFTKWAALEVSNDQQVPKGMESFILPEGLYAVFHYKGLNTDPSIFQYILGTWLPQSEYLLDSRPHFEVLGAKYKNNDPASEEEIWIPIRKK